MSGFAAIYHFDDRPVDSALLATMSERLAHRGRDDRGDWADGPAGMAVRLSRSMPESAYEVQPLVGRCGTVLALDGRIDNRDELFNLLPPQADSGRDCPDSELVSAAYDEFGLDMPGKLLGDFALAVIDPRQRRLLLARDALGARPLVYCRRHETVLVASEIKALLAHPDVDARPNEDALADFFFDHVHDLESTFFADVTNLPPAHAALVSPDGIRVWRYWDFDPRARTRLSSFQEYAERFGAHLKEATRRRLRSAHPVSISVSGGLDSSSIFCLANELSAEERQSRPLAVAYMPPDGSEADEREFLDEIELFAGTAIHRLPMAQGVLDRCMQGMWHVEAPWLDGQWNTTVEFMAWLREAGVRVMMTGNWADELLFPQAYLVDLSRRLRWREVARHLRQFGAWMTDADDRYFRRRFVMDLVKLHLPSPLLPLAYRTRVKRGAPWYSSDFKRRGYRRSWRLRRDIRSKGSAHFRSLYAEARSAHHVMCLEWNDRVAAMHGLEITYPFFDRDLVGFLMSVPGEIVSHGGVPKALLREAMRGKVPESICARRWKANFLGPINQGLVWDYDQILERLESFRVSSESGYVDHHALVPRLAQIRAGLGTSNDESAAAVLDLLGLEVWLRVFMQPEKRPAAGGAGDEFW